MAGWNKQDYSQNMYGNYEVNNETQQHPVQDNQQTSPAAPKTWLWNTNNGHHNNIIQSNDADQEVYENYNEPAGTGPNSPPVADGVGPGVVQFDSQQDLYENVGPYKTETSNVNDDVEQLDYENTALPTGVHIDDPTGENSEDNIYDNVDTGKEPKICAADSCQDVKQSTNKAKNESVSKSRKKKKKKNSKDNSMGDYASPREDGTLTLSLDKQKPDKSKIRKPSSKTVLNLYSPEPLNTRVTPGSRKSMAGFRKSLAGFVLPQFQSTDSPKKTNTITCLAVLICFSVLSVAGNLIFICVVHIRDCNVTVPSKNNNTDSPQGIDAAFRSWMDDGFQFSRSHGFLVNVASAYNWADCKASSIDSTTKGSYAKYRCQFSLDSRTQPGLVPIEWRTEPGEKEGAYLSVTFNGNHTIVALELVQNKTLAQMSVIQLTFSDGTNQTFNLTTENQANSSYTTQISLTPTVSSMINLTVLEVEPSTWHNSSLGLVEFRVFGYGDSSRSSQCCPNDLPLYNPTLRMCYGILNTTGTLTPIQASDDCKEKKAGLKLLTTQDDLFIKPYIIKENNNTWSKDFWTAFSNSSSTWLSSGYFSHNNSVLYVCQTESYCNATL